jgi:hypothetical protein
MPQEFANLLVMSPDAPRGRERERVSELERRGVWEGEREKERGGGRVWKERGTLGRNSQKIRTIWFEIGDFHLFKQICIPTNVFSYLEKKIIGTIFFGTSFCYFHPFMSIFPSEYNLFHTLKFVFILEEICVLLRKTFFIPIKVVHTCTFCFIP